MRIKIKRRRVYIGFTGHRDVRVPEHYINEIKEKYPTATWVHGGAIGFDRQIASYCRRNNLTQLCIRPSPEETEEFGIKGAYLARDRRIVDKCCKMFAAYDGREVGGTYYTVTYAKKQNKEVVCLPILDGE
jgi:hypothetical protein